MMIVLLQLFTCLALIAVLFGINNVLKHVITILRVAHDIIELNSRMLEDDDDPDDPDEEDIPELTFEEEIEKLNNADVIPIRKTGT